MAFLGFLNAEFILRKMMLGVQRRWWFDLLVWQHEAFAKIASLVTSVSPNPSVWQPGGGSFYPETSMLGKGTLWLVPDALGTLPWWGTSLSATTSEHLSGSTGSTSRPCSPTTWTGCGGCP